MDLTGFLRQLSNHEIWRRQVQRYAALSGGQIGDETYLFDLVSRSHLELRPWMPLWYVPIARLELRRCAGLDVRPEYLRKGLSQVMETLPERVLVTNTLSLDEFVQARLVRLQYVGALSGERQPPPDVLRAYEFCRTALPETLPNPDEVADAENDEDWRWAHGHRGPYLVDRIRPKSYEDPRTDLPFLLEGADVSPDCFDMLYGLTLVYLELDLVQQASECFVRALRCPRYTGSKTTEGLAGTAKLLYELAPDPFDDAAVERMNAEDPASLRVLIDKRRSQGRLEEAVRLAVDLAYIEHDTEKYIEPLLRPLFIELGWDWALKLCDFRQGKWD